jgi:hypothetical protein
MPPRSIVRASLAALCVLAGGSSLALGQHAQLTGPSRVEPGGLILLSPAGTESDEPPHIVVEAGQPAGLTPTPLYTPDGKGGFQPFAALATAPSMPGTYRFACVAVRRPDEGTPSYSVATWTVTVGTLPPPGPLPDPDDPEPPPPVPEPIAGRLHATYIVQAGAETPAHAAIRTDPHVRAAAARLDANFRTLRSDEEDIARLKYGPILARVGYPALIVQDSTGREVDALRVSTADDIIASIERLRGAR